MPLFVRWPGRIEAGTERNMPVAHLDLFPSIVAAAGAPLPADRVIDGINILPFAKGEDVEEPNRPIFWRDGYYHAVRLDGWKLQFSARPDKVWLYNLDEDPTEQNNLAADHPEKVAELKALVEAHNATQRDPLFPAVAEMPILIDKTLKEEASEEDEYIYWPG